MLQLVLQHLDLAVLVLDHLLLSLCLIGRLVKLFRLSFGDLQSLKQTLAFLLAAHKRYLQVVLLFALLIQNVLLLIKSFLQARLVFLEAASAHHIVVLLSLLLLDELFILHEGLLENASQAQALIRIGLHLVIILTRLAHLDVLLELFNLAVLHLAFELQLTVLALQLLHQERLKVVRFAAQWCLSASMHVIDLLLELASEVFDFFLFLLQVDVELLCLGAQARVLISGDIVLDLEISVHVSHLFLLCGLENWRLVSLDHIGLGNHVGRAVVIDATTHTTGWLLNRHVSTAKQNVATPVVVDDLLIDTIAFLGAAIGEAATRLNALVHGSHMHGVVELLRAGRAPNE